VLPLVALLIANRVLPLWDEEQQPS
jgi:hypothetical protein